MTSIDNGSHSLDLKITNFDERIRSTKMNTVIKKGKRKYLSGRVGVDHDAPGKRLPPQQVEPSRSTSRRKSSVSLESQHLMLRFSSLAAAAAAFAVAGDSAIFRGPGLLHSAGRLPPAPVLSGACVESKFLPCTTSRSWIRITCGVVDTPPFAPFSFRF